MNKERGYKAAVKLDGYSLNLELAKRIAHGATVRIAGGSKSRVEKSRKLVEQIAASDTPSYGINTGFGFFATKVIAKQRRRELQRNIITSHAGGFGAMLSIPETRLALALRLNLLLKGFSGARYKLCQAVFDLLRKGIYPQVPEYGSVGASGDLIPLSHLGLAIIGEGSVIYRGKVTSAKRALKLSGLKPLELAEKEGLSFVNGTEIMQSVGGLALAKAMQISRLANKITALSLEALEGHLTALDQRIHKARGQTGQIQCAQEILAELRGSSLQTLKRSHSRVQDPYSLRCAPQIHGASRDALNYSLAVVERELNAVTDNPLVIVETGKILSGGNFHGEPLAMAFDVAAIACAELGNVSERRLELMCNPNMSGLPAFLTPDPGVNSGYMVLQYLAASLVNENKLLANPAVTDSIPGNVGIEDLVSMGMTSARKLRKIVENLQAILACELLAACQAIDLRPKRKLGQGTGKVYRTLRSKLKTLGQDRIVAKDIEIAFGLLSDLG